MLLLALAVGAPVAALASAVVYADAAGRGLPSAARLRWTGGVGLASLGGFLVAFGLDGPLVRAYATVTGRPVVVTSPRQLLVGLLVAGLAVSAVAVLAYGFGSRYGPRATR